MNTVPTLAAQIREAKDALGSSLVILGHHYQRDEVIQFADFRGDSLKLARDAASCRQAKTIVFCGVHFMAETAAILAQPSQTVLRREGILRGELVNPVIVPESVAGMARVALERMLSVGG